MAADSGRRFRHSPVGGGDRGDGGDLGYRLRGDTKLGTRLQTDGVRSAAAWLRKLLAKRSREMANHHLAGDTLTVASAGPDIQAQDRCSSIFLPLLSLTAVLGTSRSVSGRFLSRLSLSCPR